MRRISNPPIGRARKRRPNRNRFQSRLGELQNGVATVRSAAIKALRAYRGIFGRGCWNSHDRLAFNELERVLSCAVPA